jgi:hypothetical protein
MRTLPSREQCFTARASNAHGGPSCHVALPARRPRVANVSRLTVEVFAGAQNVTSGFLQSQPVGSRRRRRITENGRDVFLRYFDFLALRTRKGARRAARYSVTAQVAERWSMVMRRLDDVPRQAMKAEVMK